MAEQQIRQFAGLGTPAGKPVGPHGARFDYQSLDTEVLGFIIGRITGKRPEKVLEERIWSQLGAENDANIVLDEVGSSRSAGGLSATARDFARFGEMMRRNGKFNGKQIVPAKVVAKIRAGGSKRDFANAIWDYNTRRGWSYKSQWWHTHNAGKAFMGIGMFGQAIYVDPKAEMVIVRFMSGPDGSTVGFDPITQGMFQAMRQMRMNTEMSLFTQALYDARELAMERMQAEAEGLQAEGIVGVQLVERSFAWGSHVIEFFAMGTAVVPSDGAAEIARPIMAVTLNG